MVGRTGLGAKALGTAVIVAGFSAGYVFTNEHIATTHQRSDRGGVAEQQAAAQIAPRPQAGTEVLAIFVASSTCGAAQYPGLKDALDQIRRTLTTEAEREQKRVVSVGVALDQDPWIGINFLEDFGPFDEVLSGGGWVNIGSVAFIVRDFPGRRAIPQLILVERDIAIDEDGSMSSVDERLIGRKVGSDAIVGFARYLDAGQDGES